jgi:putative ABC transport system ATP-binding protein
VILDGNDLTKLDDKSLTILRRTKIGFVFQFFNLIPVLSALENVALPLVLHGANGNSTEQARTWLKRVDLADRMGHKPSELSGGQQQRVALARALVTEPAVVLADEPTGNLDSRGAEEMLRWLRRTVDEWGRTVVMVTHDPRMAAYADRIVFMKDGTVVDDTKLGADKSAEFVFERMETLVER